MPQVFDLIVFSLLKREFNVQSILLESKLCWGFVLIGAKVHSIFKTVFALSSVYEKNILLRNLSKLSQADIS
jgi:hypothetical protein